MSTRNLISWSRLQEENKIKNKSRKYTYTSHKKGIYHKSPRFSWCISVSVHFIITQTKKLKSLCSHSSDFFLYIHSPINHLNLITSKSQSSLTKEKKRLFHFEKMKILQASLCVISLLVILPSVFSASSSSEDFDFFYFVQQVTKPLLIIII